MTQPFSDTQSEAEAVLFELLRKVPSWRKLDMVSELYDQMKILAIAGLRQRHPEADEIEIHRRLADILLGPELASEVYGPLCENATPTIPGRTAHSA